VKAQKSFRDFARQARGVAEALTRETGSVIEVAENLAPEKSSPSATSRAMAEEAVPKAARGAPPSAAEARISQTTKANHSAPTCGGPTWVPGAGGRMEPVFWHHGVGPWDAANARRKQLAVPDCV
jgi:hypothetical protein